MTKESESDRSLEGSTDCVDSIERLYLYLDGELTEDRRTAIRTHLDQCGPCVAMFDFEVELRRVIADRCKDHVPATLQERIAQAIAAERSSAEGR